MVKKVIKKEAKINLKVRKAPTKAELELQVKQWQQTNDDLEKNIELLVSFEVKIKKLEAQIDILSCKETQTEIGLNLKCDECNFEAED